MVKLKYTFLFSVIICFFAFLGQIARAQIVDPPKFGSISPFGSEINTTAEETFPLLTPDGKKFYFSRISFQEKNGLQIYSSSYKNNIWQKPVIEQKLNTQANNAVVGTSLDTRTTYLMSQKNGKKGIHSITLDNNITEDINIAFRKNGAI